VRGQRLAPNYTGWFAGVPVRVNNLGLRDDDGHATVAKQANTYRILVLGDSVTFGHGSVHTYPALLETLLKQWRPDIDWQVWNAGVPGYNTSQELAYLLEVGPSFQPDLVVVGFFENDLIDNGPIAAPSVAARLGSRVLGVAQRHVYSFQFYKRVLLSLAWWVSGSTAYSRRLEHLETESALLNGFEPVHERPEQQLTDYARLTHEGVQPEDCFDRERPEPGFFDELQRSEEWTQWMSAVRSFQHLHASGQYKVLFFLNMVPPICSSSDFFYGGESRQLNDLYLKVMGHSTPATSAFDTFLRRRPSQMPAARGHAIGNANLTKAEALFDYLRTEFFPTVSLPAGDHASR
jgi:hypothetical protein